MSAELRKSLIQLAFPTVAIIVGLAVARFRDISLSGDLLLVAPSWSQALFWLAIWILWIAASELVSRRLGLPQPSTWETHEPGVIVLRIFTLVIMAPIAEEFVFRGLLFQRIASTGLGIVGAILITAGVFAVLHVQYRRDQAALIFLDGLVFGVALYTSSSLVMPMLMHVIGNLYAVYQRLPDSFRPGKG
jgi:membrane protease YdiL (CAAX protease family)